MSKTNLGSYLKKHTACLKCISQNQVGKCTHGLLGASEDSMFRSDRQVAHSDEPEFTGEPQRKRRNRKKVWYPQDFHKDLSNRGKLAF